MSAYDPPRLYFEPLKLLNFVINADPDPAIHCIVDPDTAFRSNADPDSAFHSNSEPDPASKNNADPNPQPWTITKHQNTYHVNGCVLVGTSLGGGPGLGLQVEGGDPVEAVHGEGGAAPQHVQTLPVAADLVPISEQYVVTAALWVRIQTSIKSTKWAT
jgi:hypothetical protein